MSKKAYKMYVVTYEDKGEVRSATVDADYEAEAVEKMRGRGYKVIKAINVGLLLDAKKIRQHG